MIYALLGLLLACLLEGAVIYFIVKRMVAIKEQAKENAAAVLEARQALEGVNELLEKRKFNEGKAKDEKQELANTPDSGLAGRANSLFDH